MFVQLLDSKDVDVQFYCAAALSNLAVHGLYSIYYIVVLDVVVYL